MNVKGHAPGSPCHVEHAGSLGLMIWSLPLGPVRLVEMLSGKQCFDEEAEAPEEM